jgi:hypothetical protein
MLTNSACEEKYPGPPLPTEHHIRLLLLQPGSGAEPVHCQLLVTTLASAPAYESLSYVWGDALNPVTIHLQAPESDIYHEHAVTQNCFAALQRLRYEDRPRTMWIDALCIDQSNIPEQSHQITLMSDIYSQASGVVVYLGESSADSDLAIDCIIHYDDPEPGSLLTYGRSDALVEALYNLFRRPWFGRVWVIQEVAFARKATVICGTRIFDWSALTNFRNIGRLRSWIRKLPYVIGVSKPKFPEWLLQNQDAGGEFILKELNRARHCHATDPRDKIYALLPFLYGAQLGIDISPNYADPCTTVFTQYAAALVTAVKFGVLQAAQGRSVFQNLPSWVPDWTVPLKSAPPRSLARTRRSYPSPSEQQAYQLRVVRLETKDVNRPMVEQPAYVLKAFGFDDGHVVKIGSTYVAGHGAFPLDEWKVVVSNKSSGSALSSEEEEALEIAISTFNHGLDVLETFLQMEEEKQEDKSQDHSWETSIRDLTRRHDDSEVLSYREIPFLDAGVGMYPSARTVVEDILERCHCRRIFVTDTGRVGLGPAELQLGDAVYTCIGADVQFAFRDAEARETSRAMDGKRLELVGECFVAQTKSEELSQTWDRERMEWMRSESDNPSTLSDPPECFYIV